MTSSLVSRIGVYCSLWLGVVASLDAQQANRASSPAASAPSGLVAWWPGDGDGADVLGANPALPGGGVRFLPGIVGQAFALAEDASIEVPHTAALSYSGNVPMSVELWACRTGSAQSMQIVNKRTGKGDAEFQLASTPERGLAFGGIGPDGVASMVATPLQLPRYQWWHIAATFDGVTLSLYVNGALVASAPGQLGPANTSPLRIGALGAEPREAFEGLLDEVSFYNRALKADEILAIYQAGTSGKIQSPPNPEGPIQPPAGLVSWWSGDGTAEDVAGLNDGTLQLGATYAPGLVGQAFSVREGAYVEIPSSPSLHFAGRTPLTVELWAYRTGNAPVMELITKRATVHDSEFQMAFDPNTGLCFGSIDVYETRSYVMTRLQMPLNQWWHLAGTFDGSELRFYTNGELAASAPGKLGTTNEQPVRIGAIDYSPSREAWEGLIDEVSLYNRALGPAEIRGIYRAGAAGKRKVFIDDSPVDQVGYWGKTATFFVNARGATPLTFQWLKDGVAVPGATNATLTLADLKFSDAGAYAAVVASGTTGGGVKSAPAMLQVNPAGVSLGLFPGVVIDGVVGKSYAIQCATNLHPNPRWTTVTNLTLTDAVQVWVDASANTRAPGQPERFYQVVPGQ